MMHDSGKYKV